MTSQFFGYDSSYHIADTIQPGYAYWVKVSQGGSLILTSSDIAPTSGFISIVPDTGVPPPPPPEVLGNTTTAQLSLKAGWNMVSVPITALDFQTTAIFPNAVSNAFSYTAGQYTSETTLRNGAGYWVKYGAAANPNIEGYFLASDTFSVSAGWNLVGSVGNRIPVSGIASAPGGMIASQFFGFDQFYAGADTLVPGKAYWVKVNQAGQLILSSATMLPSNCLTIVPTEELPPAPPIAKGQGALSQIPEAFGLLQNYPNPFNPSTVIRYELPVDSYVTLKVYDVLGRLVETIVDGSQEAGYRTATWKASSSPSGIYFYTLKAGTFTETKKLLLLR